jgi:hypothetical protein
MNKVWYIYLGWIVAAGVLGFAISGIFAGALRLPRNIYLIPYIGLAGLFLYAYARWSGLSIVNLLRHNWQWGVDWRTPVRRIHRQKCPISAVLAKV